MDFQKRSWQVFLLLVVPGLVNERQDDHTMIYLLVFNGHAGQKAYFEIYYATLSNMIENAHATYNVTLVTLIIGLDNNLISTNQNKVHTMYDMIQLGDSFNQGYT